MTKLAVVLVRSLIGLNKEILRTLELLKLKKKNNCIIIEDSPEKKGMLKKIERLITWGEIDDDTLEKIKAREKKGVYFLQPPRKGFGRKGVKMPFNLGGGLGYRGKKINDLLQRMV